MRRDPVRRLMATSMTARRTAVAAVVAAAAALLQLRRLPQRRRHAKWYVNARLPHCALRLPGAAAAAAAATDTMPLCAGAAGLQAPAPAGGRSDSGLRRSARGQQQQQRRRRSPWWQCRSCCRGVPWPAGWRRAIHEAQPHGSASRGCWPRTWSSQCAAKGSEACYSVRQLRARLRREHEHGCDCIA